MLYWNANVHSKRGFEGPCSGQSERSLVMSHGVGMTFLLCFGFVWSLPVWGQPTCTTRCAQRCLHIKVTKDAKGAKGAKSAVQTTPRAQCVAACQRDCIDQMRRCRRSCEVGYIQALRSCNQRHSRGATRSQCHAKAWTQKLRCLKRCGTPPQLPPPPKACYQRCRTRFRTHRKRCRTRSLRPKRCFALARRHYFLCNTRCRRAGREP